MSVYDFVISSSVRVDTLRALSATPGETDEIIDRLAASQSAVYTALTDLEQRSVIYETDGVWDLTGQGRLILDLIEESHAIEQLFERDREYWETHRTDVLPRKYRQRLPVLGPYEIIRSEPPDVRAHSREIITRLESAETCDTATHIHVPRYKQAFPNNSDSRAIMSPTVVEQLHREIEQGALDGHINDAIPKRVLDIEFGVLIGDSFVLLGLPPQEEKQLDTVLLSTDDEAIQWARELYDELWRAAEPLDSYRRRNHF